MGCGVSSEAGLSVTSDSLSHHPITTTSRSATTTGSTRVTRAIAVKGYRHERPVDVAEDAPCVDPARSSVHKDFLQTVAPAVDEAAGRGDVVKAQPTTSAAKQKEKRQSGGGVKLPFLAVPGGPISPANVTQTHLKDHGVVSPSPQHENSVSRSGSMLIGSATVVSTPFGSFTELPSDRKSDPTSTIKLPQIGNGAGVPSIPTTTNRTTSRSAQISPARQSITTKVATASNASPDGTSTLPRQLSGERYSKPPIASRPSSIEKRPSVDRAASSSVSVPPVRPSSVLTREVLLDRERDLLARQAEFARVGDRELARTVSISSNSDSPSSRKRSKVTRGTMTSNKEVIAAREQILMSKPLPPELGMFASSSSSSACYSTDPTDPAAPTSSRARGEVERVQASPDSPAQTAPPMPTSTVTFAPPSSTKLSAFNAAAASRLAIATAASISSDSKQQVTRGSPSPEAPSPAAALPRGHTHDVVPIQDIATYSRLYSMYAESSEEYQLYKREWEAEQIRLREDREALSMPGAPEYSRSLYTPDPSIRGGVDAGEDGTPDHALSPSGGVTPSRALSPGPRASSRLGVCSPLPGGERAGRLIADGTALCLLVESSHHASMCASPVPGYKLVRDSHRDSDVMSPSLLALGHPHARSSSEGVASRNSSGTASPNPLSPRFDQRDDSREGAFMQWGSQPLGSPTAAEGPLSPSSDEQAKAIVQLREQLMVHQAQQKQHRKAVALHMQMSSAATGQPQVQPQPQQQRRPNASSSVPTQPSHRRNISQPTFQSVPVATTNGAPAATVHHPAPASLPARVTSSAPSCNASKTFLISPARAVPARLLPASSADESALVASSPGQISFTVHTPASASARNTPQSPLAPPTLTKETLILSPNAARRKLLLSTSSE